MVKGHRWLAVGVAGISLVIPGIAQAQGRAPVEAPLGQPASGAGTGTGSGAALPQAQGSFKAPAQIRPGQAISVLVFPFGFLGAEAAPAAPAAGVVPPPDAAAAAAGGLTQEQQHVASYITAAVKAGFLSSPYYSVASFHPNSSLIQRAQKDEILRPEHVLNLVSPTTGGPDVERARTVTYRLGMQGMLVGTIDLKTDAKANTSEVTLETQLINSTTGEVIRSAAVSGAAAGAAGVPLEIVQERAAQDAAQKVLPALGIQLVALPGETPAAKGSSRRSEAQSDKAAKKAAADAKKADEAAKRQAKEESEKAERASREQARAAEKAKRDAEKKAKTQKSASAPTAEPKVQQDAPAAPAPAPAAGAPAVVAAPEASITGTVPGTSNAAGQPVPYGYALGDSRSAVPQRERGGLRVPAWMGVAAFLYGLTFLVY